MDDKSQIYLDQILKKDVATLTESDIRFIRARRSYLKKYQLEEYEDILEPKETVSGDVVPYNELLKQAKALGYNGNRVKRVELEAYIKEHTV